MLIIDTNKIHQDNALDEIAKIEAELLRIAKNKGEFRHDLFKDLMALTRRYLSGRLRKKNDREIKYNTVVKKPLSKGNLILGLEIGDSYAYECPEHLSLQLRQRILNNARYLKQGWIVVTTKTHTGIVATRIK